ncbi:hypothetical protein KPH14_007695 [Odynerus spinipes]|uniref:Uncharacterized protein n=1 Tax=Odynerus spinipes TaxID=1348599 RepID=A0AAD9RJ21_9HYME|nr:hypothetical protein KPH14_007695 [Odynerus spinipes]
MKISSSSATYTTVMDRVPFSVRKSFVLIPSESTILIIVKNKATLEVCNLSFSFGVTRVYCRNKQNINRSHGAYERT